MQRQLEEFPQSFTAIAAVATCRDSLCFADLCWPPFDFDVELKRVTENRDPGVIFETPSRVVVIEEHSGELRYYAGGWRSCESRLYLEQDRIDAEGFEMGVFHSMHDAMLFSECFLVGNEVVQNIEAGRNVRHRRDTDYK